MSSCAEQCRSSKPARAWRSSFSTWAILLERHIRKEERELFPLFEAHVDAAQAEPIGAKLKELLNRQG